MARDVRRDTGVKEKPDLKPELQVVFEGGPFDGQSRMVPIHTCVYGKIDVPVMGNLKPDWFKQDDEEPPWHLDYKVAEYVRRGDVWEFERWKR